VAGGQIEETAGIGKVLHAGGRRCLAGGEGRPNLGSLACPAARKQPDGTGHTVTRYDSPDRFPTDARP
jgi:hypothetical protein